MPTAPRRFVNHILDLMFPCDHRQQSWPQTRDGKTYKTCLHCGHEAQYSMEDMCDITPAYVRFKRKMLRQAARERLNRMRAGRQLALGA